MKTSYTRHAWSRVLSRLSLTPAEVADLLDWNLSVAIGIESGTGRVHRLFFSAPDGMCFVAVQDQANGAVVTVLPVDFHENIAWQVSRSAQEQAKALACPEIGPRPRHVARAAPTGASGPAVFRLGAYVRGASGLVKGVNLGSWPCRPYDGRVERLLEDDEFFRALNERLASKGVRNDDVEAVYVRLGNHGTPTRISS